MNSRMTPRGGYPLGTQQPYHPAPNAALLIDFDNVTMAIRSDLGKEIKALLKSDVIRGKVAVQRAYADWRRYPQYIVPLTEASVDLIFAPAYGSSKKNATDLRMAIDAMELVFIRPEIGTFILMTGDSDFSSCVLKLKEYGKYVIGVGMRESSSDLLIQNCDEYYSYHSISGLTRAGEIQESGEDPWVLVRRAVQQMVKDSDVMRTDRLKQVMLDLNPAFDEKKLGYSKFSRFVSEAAEKGLLRLRRTEAGQYEILTDAGEPADKEAREKEAPEKEPREKVVERIVAEAEAAGNGRRRRGRGRDDRPREGRRGEEREPEPEKVASGADKGSERQEQPELAGVAAEAAATEGSSTTEVGPGAGVPDLDHAYALLQEAVRRLTGRDGKTARDGDVKRRMLEISREFDEGRLGFSKFTRFLRQAHDAEVIDLNRVGAGNYEVSLPSGGKRLPPPRAVTGAGAEEREPAARKEPVAAQVEARVETQPVGEEARPEQATPPTAPKVGGIRGRRGTRGAAAGPPPILPGQVVAPPGKAAAVPEATGAAGEEKPEEAKPARSRSRRGRRGGKKPEAPAAASTAEAPVESEAAAPEATSAAPESTRGGQRARRGTSRAAREDADAGRKKASKSAGAERPRRQAKKSAADEAPAFSASALGLPEEPAAVVNHLSSYKGIGKKTADTLVEKFGAGVFEALQNRSDEVRGVVGERRAEGLLEQWSADYQQRVASLAESADSGPTEDKPPTSSRGRRGGRGRGGSKKAPTS